MRSYHIYNQYKTCLHKAKQAFGHYDKYKRCFSVSSIDKEMGEILMRLGLHCSKLMGLVSNRDKIADAGEPDLVSIDECEKLLKEKASFFNNMICFLERNEKRILKVLGNRSNAETMGTEVLALETNLSNADRLVNRMDNMIRSSQQIYVHEQG